MAPHDVCVAMVSHNCKGRLDAALTSLFEHSGWLDLDVVVVDNGSDGSAEHVEAHFPTVRVIRCPNHGVSHAYNQVLETANARYMLFLHPDTEVLEGNLSELVSALDRQPEIALAGVRQHRSDGSLAPSMKRFPSFGNMLAEALGVARVPGVRRVLGEHELDLRQYDRQRECDWTSGAFMLVRREALERIGWFDQRFLLFYSEADLCWRLKRAGWGVVHMPSVAIRHHGSDRRTDAKLQSQVAYARMQFARKHFPYAAADFRWALGLRYALRIGLYSVLRGCRKSRQQAARAALATVVRRQSPFYELSVIDISS